MDLVITRLRDGRQGKQQNVVGVVGVAVPLALTVLAVQAPGVSVTSRRKSAGSWTASHENGASYVMVLPVHVLEVDDDTATLAEHAAPLTAPQEHVVHPRASSTPP